MNTYSYKEAHSIVASICKAAKEGAYDTRDKFLAMLDANPDVAAQGYTVDGTIRFWNRASAELYGHTDTEAMGRNVFDTILPPDLRMLARSLVETALKTGKTPEASSCDLLHRNGDFITVHSGHLLFYWDGPDTPEFYCVDVGIAPSDEEM